ncbi:hypothetical protein ACVIN2_002796 [Bradyrhizobium sp. USDA 3650]
MREASHGCDGLDPLQFHYCMTLSLSDICKIVIRPAEASVISPQNAYMPVSLTTRVARARRTYWLRICRQAVGGRET